MRGLSLGAIDMTIGVKTGFESNTQHVDILREGVESWNRWRKREPSVKPMLCGLRVDNPWGFGVNMDRADLRNVDFRAADLPHTNFVGADLREADFTGASLRGACFDEADLRGAKFIRVDLHAKMSAGSVDVLMATSFRNADLRNAVFHIANLSDADMSNSRLGSATMHTVIFAGAHLRNVDFANADLTAADFYQADLSGAKMCEAILHYAIFHQTILLGADFTSSRVREATFSSVDLSEAKGIASIVHQGPSALDIDTIRKSNGKIPVAFLRGCGLTDELINFLPSVLKNRKQFYSCFISYSAHDKEFAARIYDDLQSKGIRCWFAEHDVSAGRKLHEQIHEAIRHHDRLLLVLSRHSMNSEWVRTEISEARQKELNQGVRVLLPIGLVPFSTIREWRCFDADMGKDSAREIREYYIPDFSNWKNPHSYQKAFEGLVRDLRVTEPRVSS
jgi:hypothetical protein